MFKIIEKKSLNPTVSKITVEAPLIARRRNRDNLLFSVLRKIAREYL